MNLPNYLTLSRIAVIPLFIWILSPKFPFMNGPYEREVTAALLFVAASITDGLDGYLARKRNQITTLGMLLDPLADKLMVTAAFITLVQYNPSVVPAWIAVLVIAREFLVSGLRSIAAQEGFTIEASDLGKFKTVVQIVAITAAILNHGWETWDFGRYFVMNIELIARTAMWIMVGISLISAWDYFYGFWSKVSKRVERRTRRPFVLSRRKRARAANRPVVAPPETRH